MRRPHIRSVAFQSFRVLRDARLPLSRLTIVAGPNGAGKSTIWRALAALRRIATGGPPPRLRPPHETTETPPEISVRVEFDDDVIESLVQGPTGPVRHAVEPLEAAEQVRAFWTEARYFDLFHASACKLEPERSAAVLGRRGENLGVVLARLAAEHGERFDALETELTDWFPEYDRVLLADDHERRPALALRSARGGYAIPAEDLSGGTLLALCVLVQAHLPTPPSLMFIEEPDATLHPRLMPYLKDALTRLAFPDAAGDPRPPCQVVATTHSPYFLNLFRDELDAVVMASPGEVGGHFTRLSDLPHVEELVGDCSLGEAWYTGALGGVPRNG